MALNVSTATRRSLFGLLALFAVLLLSMSASAATKTQGQFPDGPDAWLGTPIADNGVGTPTAENDFDGSVDEISLILETGLSTPVTFGFSAVEVSPGTNVAGDASTESKEIVMGGAPSSQNFAWVDGSGGNMAVEFDWRIPSDVGVVDASWNWELCIRSPTVAALCDNTLPKISARQNPVLGAQDSIISFVFYDGSSFFSMTDGLLTVDNVSEEGDWLHYAFGFYSDGVDDTYWVSVGDLYATMTETTGTWPVSANPWMLAFGAGAGTSGGSWTGWMDNQIWYDDVNPSALVTAYTATVGPGIGNIMEDVMTSIMPLIFGMIALLMVGLILTAVFEIGGGMKSNGNGGKR